MSLGLLLGAVEAGALEYNVNTDLAPGQLSCLRLSVNCDLLAINDDAAFACFYSVQTLADSAAVAALSGVVLQKLCQHLGICQIVDCYDLISLSAEHLSESQTADTAKTIDCYFNCHWIVPPNILCFYYTPSGRIFQVL